MGKQRIKNKLATEHKNETGKADPEEEKKDERRDKD